MRRLWKASDGGHGGDSSIRLEKGSSEEFSFDLAVASFRNLVLLRDGLLRGSAKEVLRNLYVEIV